MITTVFDGVLLALIFVLLAIPAACLLGAFCEVNARSEDAEPASAPPVLPEWARYV